MQHVVSQLSSKISEIKGEIKYHEIKIKALQETIRSIDKSIRLFDPEFDKKALLCSNFTKKVSLSPK